MPETAIACSLEFVALSPLMVHVLPEIVTELGGCGSFVKYAPLFVARARLDVPAALEA